MDMLCMLALRPLLCTQSVNLNLFWTSVLRYAPKGGHFRHYTKISPSWGNAGRIEAMSAPKAMLRVVWGRNYTRPMMQCQCHIKAVTIVIRKCVFCRKRPRFCLFADFFIVFSNEPIKINIWTWLVLILTGYKNCLLQKSVLYVH